MNDLAIAAAASADTAYASAPAPDAEKGVPAVIRVLILEDNPNDAALMADTLRRAGIRPEWERVDNVADFTAHLVPGIDLILSDYDLPGLTGLQALELVRSRGLEIPFILVSGSIGEDVAVEAMRKGADDYLLKDRMARLGHAARHAIEKRRLYVDAARAEAAKLESERRFGDMLANVELVSLMLDREARITYVNDFLLRLTGWRRDEVLGANWCELFAPDDTGELQGIFSALLEDRPDARHQEIEIRTRAGGHRLIRWNNTVLRAATGEVIGTASIGEDITERKLQERRIEKLSRIRSLSSEINSAIIRSTSRQALFDAACRIAVVHGKFGIAWIGTYDAKRQEITPVASAGLEDSDFLMREKLVVREDAPQRRSISGIAIRERRPNYNNDIAADAEVGGKRRQEALRRGYGSSIVLPLTVEGEIFGIMSLFAREPGFFDEEEVGLLTEVSGNISLALEHEGRQERLDYLSYYDEITGLPNRALFLDRAGQQLRARGSEMLMVAIILLNVERFRNINETFGRHGGDELLRLVARRLEDAFQGKDYIARVTADGFGVVIRGVRDGAAVAHAVEGQVMKCFREPFALDGSEIRVAAKAGIALYPADGGDADTLFKNAEAALKNARQSGERYLFYAAEMNARAAQALSLETRLRKAVEEQQFVLHYQPKMLLTTRSICGVEALLRWQEPGAGLVPPGHFIPLLEETRLILEVGKWALGRALADHGVWMARGLLVPRIAVNLSAIQLDRRDFTDTVMEALAQHGDDPDVLELEITESVLMKDVQASTSKLSILRGLGVRIAMDDFGTGYSSLSYIARLPIDSLKIDRSFIAAMADNAQDMAIVSTIVTLAHSLNLKVVAEGVETEEQSKLLALLKCNEAQGFLYSRPVPASEIERILPAKRALAGR